jgi:hypothetical protein
MQIGLLKKSIAIAIFILLLTTSFTIVTSVNLNIINSKNIEEDKFKEYIENENIRDAKKSISEENSNENLDSPPASFEYRDNNWWNSGWSYRKLITINSSQVEVDLMNFPVLVYNASDSDLASRAQDDGDDIAFVLYSDNSTQLNHEIELFNGTTGEIVAWVNITSLSSTVDTKIWMYYNNSGASSQENMTGVWDDNYVGVWHFKEGSGSLVNDSTAYGNYGTLSQTDHWVTTGKIANAYDFDGAEYVDLGLGLNTSSFTEITAEAWFKGYIFLY